MTGATASLRAQLRRRPAKRIELCASLVRIPSENPPRDTSRIAAFGGRADGRFFRRAGIPTAVYGLRVRGMGGPDESIEARELVDVATVHLGVVVDYLGMDAR